MRERVAGNTGNWHTGRFDRVLTVEPPPGILVTVRPPVGWCFDTGDESVAVEVGVHRVLRLRR
jgi:hypothetical protein